MTNPPIPSRGERLERTAQVAGDKSREASNPLFPGVPMQKLDHGKLLERLRERWEAIPGAAATKINRILKERKEAADAIERLSSEHSVLTEEVERLEGLRDLHAALTGEVERAQAAEDRALASNEQLTKALEKSKADADLCAAEWVKEIEASNAARTLNKRMRKALTKLRDCDWTIGRGDRMDPVRDIAREGLEVCGLPDPASHPTGWIAAKIDGRWCVGMAGNLDTIHDAVLVVNNHSDDDAHGQAIAEWVATAYSKRAAQSQWQDIASAPRDDTSILIWSKYGVGIASRHWLQSSPTGCPSPLLLSKGETDVR